MSDKKVCIKCNKEYSYNGPTFFEQNDGTYICLDCYTNQNECECSNCGKISNVATRSYYNEFEGILYCGDCYNSILSERCERILISTTNNFEGFSVKEYLGIESVEIVIGTGWFSEFTGEISDALGLRSSQFEKKLQNAKDTALLLLKKKAYEKGANAIIGADLDYTEFSSNRVGIILNGTLVKVEKIS